MALPSPPELIPRHRRYLEYKRRAMIMELGALEDMLGIPRTIPQKDKKKKVTPFVNNLK